MPLLTLVCSKIGLSFLLHSKVSKIKHRATIEVTKEGTVGAAASAIELVALSASLSAPKTIDINKPFLEQKYT